jgi:SAM-dependent methyltransferase
VKTFSTAFRRERTRTVPCALCGKAPTEKAWECGSFSFVRCGRCGLLRQDPQPVPEDVASRYGPGYLDYEAAHELRYRDLELMALRDIGFEAIESRLLGAGGRPRFLDVGCATGCLLAAVRDRGWDARGVEICRESAEYGKSTYGLDIAVMPLEGAHFPDAAFDLVHASHLIEHLNDPAGMLRESRRILSDEGLLVLTTPNSDGLQARALGGEWRSAIFDHLWLFSRRNLAALLAANGFRVVRAKTWGGWAEGLKPAIVKPALDRAAKLLGFGDVMVVLARKAAGREGEKCESPTLRGSPGLPEIH